MKQLYDFSMSHLEELFDIDIQTFWLTQKSNTVN